MPILSNRRYLIKISTPFCFDRHRKSILHFNDKQFLQPKAVVSETTQPNNQGTDTTLILSSFYMADWGKRAWNWSYPTCILISRGGVCPHMLLIAIPTRDRWNKRCASAAANFVLTCHVPDLQNPNPMFDAAIWEVHSSMCSEQGAQQHFSNSAPYPRHHQCGLPTRGGNCSQRPRSRCKFRRVNSSVRYLHTLLSARHHLRKSARELCTSHQKEFDFSNVPFATGSSVTGALAAMYFLHRHLRR